MVKSVTNSLILIMFIACSDRISDPQADGLPDTGREQKFSNYLTLVSPFSFGDIISTTQGEFVEGLFLDYDGNAVWGVFRVRNGRKERLSMQINFSEPLRFTMYTHKYFDESNHYHTAISAALPVDPDNPVESILLAVAVSGDSAARNNEFETVQPSRFGEIIDTEQGPFIEAFFAGLSADSVWSIEETISNGNTFKVDLTRRVGLPLAYYLIPGEYRDGSGGTTSGIRVGLPYHPEFPQKNIHVLIRR